MPILAGQETLPKKQMKRLFATKKFYYDSI